MTVDCVEFCKALADETRQRILVMLTEREMSVSDIVDVFTMSQPTISHHLGVLKHFGLVTSRKEGKQVSIVTTSSNAADSSSPSSKPMRKCAMCERLFFYRDT